MKKIGKYEVIERIGTGGFGLVYRARDPFIKRTVAIKTCVSRIERIRKRFHREAEIIGSLAHRNITTVHDFGVHEDVPYLVEEFLTGRDLKDHIDDGATLSLERKLDYLIQICRGLGYAHTKDIVHRDIKPANMRILEDDTVKIMDFGTAKRTTAETQLTQTGMTVGTAAYLSPEQIKDQTLDGRSDIFSFGILAYELLTYRRPYEGANLSILIQQILYDEPTPLGDLLHDCPPDLAFIVHRCLERDRDQRYRDCSELESDFATFISTHLVEPSTPRVTQRDSELCTLLDHRVEVLLQDEDDALAFLLLQTINTLTDEDIPQRKSYGEIRSRLLNKYPPRHLQELPAQEAPPSKATVPIAIHQESKKSLTERFTSYRQQRKITKLSAFLDRADHAVRSRNLKDGIRSLERAHTLVHDDPSLIEAEERRLLALPSTLIQMTEDSINHLQEHASRVEALILERTERLLPFRRWPQVEALFALADRLGLQSPLLDEAHDRVLDQKSRPLSSELSDDAKTSEAIRAVTDRLGRGRLYDAASALTFAHRLHGDFPQVKSLKKAIVRQVGSDFDTLKVQCSHLVAAASRSANQLNSSPRRQRRLLKALQGLPLNDSLRKLESRFASSPPGTRSTPEAEASSLWMMAKDFAKFGQKGPAIMALKQLLEMNPNHQKAAKLLAKLSSKN